MTDGFVLQAWVLLTGGLSMWLVSDQRSGYRRLACLIGLCGQPVWLITTFTQSQWGMFALSLIASASFIRGVLRKTTTAQVPT